MKKGFIIDSNLIIAITSTVGLVALFILTSKAVLPSFLPGSNQELSDYNSFLTKLSEACQNGNSKLINFETKTNPDKKSSYFITQKRISENTPEQGLIELGNGNLKEGYKDQENDKIKISFKKILEKTYVSIKNLEKCLEKTCICLTKKYDFQNTQTKEISKENCKNDFKPNIRELTEKDSNLIKQATVITRCHENDCLEELETQTRNEYVTNYNKCLPLNEEIKCKTLEELGCSYEKNSKIIEKLLHLKNEENFLIQSISTKKSQIYLDETQKNSDTNIIVLELTSTELN